MSKTLKIENFEKLKIGSVYCLEGVSQIEEDMSKRHPNERFARYEGRKSIEGRVLAIFRELGRITSFEVGPQDKVDISSVI